MLNWKGVCLYGLLMALVAVRVQAADPFTVAPAAAWVDVRQAVASPNLPAVPTGENVRYLLLDDQVDVATTEHYRHVVKEVLNADGVQDEGQLNLDFDPSFQQLIIHDISIRRGTNRLNRLDPDKIKVIQQEKELDMFVFNGEVSAVSFLEDLRVGDQIDYSYTVRGANPIFGGRYIDDCSLQWADPVAYERFRLLWPANRALSIKNHGTSISPVVHENGATKEYLWELHDVPAIVEEDALPTWYDAYPWVQFSEFASWKDVADWALRLYPKPEKLDPELQEKIAAWERHYPDPEARVAAALTFVQDEIRYMGIEVGPNSHQPNPPGLVVSRRFGDCKDKAYLFCSILQAMNIDASEVLVATDDRRAIGDWLPSPYAFDHVVARVQLNGRTYWLDPTESHQGGSIVDHFFPDYGFCLVVRPGTTELTALPEQRNGWPKTVVQETFVVHGHEKPAEFVVRTRAEGLDADSLREDFADQRREELEKNYLNFYAREYPKIKSTQPVEVIDHREQNVFETVEHYQIDEFWTLSDDKQQYECEFYPQSIRNALTEPKTTLRSMPLAIDYPVHQLLQTEVVLPEDWPIKEKDLHLRAGPTRLDVRYHVDKNTFRMDYEYQTLTNFVAPADMPAYAKGLGQMKDALGYSLTWANDKAPTGSGDIDWKTIAIIAGIVLALVLFFGVVLVIAGIIFYLSRRKRS